MNNISVLGVDLAKNVFQVYAEDRFGNRLFNRQYKRKAFIKFIQSLSPCLIGMEACGTAHHWGRFCKELGHEVKLMNPKRIKAYLNGNKNDNNDAEAICEATLSKKVRGILVKTIPQQRLTSMHRARSIVVKRKTQMANHIRSMLAEYGLVTGVGYAALVRLIEDVLAGEHIPLDEGLCFVLHDLYEELKQLANRIKSYNQKLKKLAKENKSSAKLLDMLGIGEITATAIIAKVEDFSVFKTGRDFAAWLGLTPKEYSSAEKRKMGGISKKGDRYLRTLLIHGARAAIQATIAKDKRSNAYYRWIHSAVERLGKNKAAVALANKHARMIWAIMYHDRKVNLSDSEQYLMAA